MFVLIPEIIFPEVENPMVESTVITLESFSISSITFVFPVTSNVPVINSASSNPTKTSSIK